MKDAVEFLSNFKGLQIFVACDERTKTNPPWHFHCDFEEALPKLAERQKQNWGAYFTVNELDKSLDPERKRTKKMLKKIRAVFCEFDDKTELPNFPLKPSISVETSPGKYHFYWLTTTDNLEEWQGVQQCIVNNYGGDNNAKDITRYLRIPGFNHCKQEPTPVKLLDNNGRTYSWEVILVAFPPETRSNTKNETNPQSETQSKTLALHDQDILFGRHFHGPTMAHLQRIKDGDPPYLIKAHLKNLFELAQNFRDQWQKPETEWQSALNTIDYQVDEYVKTLGQVKTKKKVKASKTNNIPDFPKDVMKDWPEPWPMIWENYKRIPRTLDECLLLPTVLAVHSFLLNSTFVNEWDKRPNLAFLSIAMSTANKDVNSKNVISTITNIMAEKGHTSIPFMTMSNGYESISSDTAFLESFNEAEDLFWVNTEATHLFQQMAQAGAGNSSVKAIESKIIDVVDGGVIRGKRKAGKDGNVKSINDPNCQILLYTQPETISVYLKGSMIDSGLLGRMILHIPVQKGNPFDTVFIRRKKEQKELDDELVTLYTNLPAKRKDKHTAKPSDKDLKTLSNWMKDFIRPLSKGNEHAIKMLLRLGISAEQLYTVVLGICNHWDYVNKQKIRENIDVKCLLPLLNYWAQCKIYVINEFIDQSIDPLADAILDIIKDLISGKIKPNKFLNFAKENNCIPKHEVYRVISSRTKLKRELDARGDTKNIRERINRMLDIFIKDGILVTLEQKRTIFIAFPDDGEE